MDQVQANQYPKTVAEFRPNDLKNEVPNDDQCFLLYFIVGTYFGPNIKGESTKKSVLQRVAEGLPPYTCDQLTSSCIKVVEMERIYYHILRNADKLLTVKLPFLHRFFQGLDGAAIGNYPHFPDLFPPQLHPQSRFKIRYNMVHNIVFINNPEVFYLRPEDVERFKRLSGVEDFHVDKGAARLHTCFDGSVYLCNMSAGKAEHNESCCTSTTSSQKARKSDDFSELEDQLPHAHVVEPISSVPWNGNNAPEDETDPDRVGPARLFLPSRPTQKEWSDIVAATKNGFGLTGSAAMGRVGPIIGLVDIGECEDSYLFRMSLPGVKRDESKFLF